MVVCKWIFTVKLKPDGSWTGLRHAWLQKDIAKHMDWTIMKHFSPVAKLNSVRTLISLAANLD